MKYSYIEKDVQCTHVIALRRLHNKGLEQYICGNFYHANSSKRFVNLRIILFSMDGLGWNGHIITWLARFDLLSSFLFVLGFTFLFVALSTGAVLAYSGCAGSFSTNNLTGHHNIKVIKERDCKSCDSSHFHGTKCFNALLTWWILNIKWMHFPNFPHHGKSLPKFGIRKETY